MDNGSTTVLNSELKTTQTEEESQSNSIISSGNINIVTNSPLVISGPAMTPQDKGVDDPIKEIPKEKMKLRIRILWRIKMRLVKRRKMRLKMRMSQTLVIKIFQHRVFLGVYN